MRFVIKKLSDEEMKSNTKKLLKGFDFEFVKKDGDLLHIKLKGKSKGKENEVIRILCEYKFKNRVSTPRVIV